MKEQNLTKMLNSMNIKVINEDVFQTAFTHSSFKGLSVINTDIEDYERLEFLGDSILDSIVAMELYIKEYLSEGEMTNRRIELVNNSYLSKIFDILNFRPLIRAAINYQPSTKDKANFVEAFFGALSISQKFEKCVEVWNLIEHRMDKYKESKGLNNQNNLNPVEKAKRIEFQAFYTELDLKRNNAKNMLQDLCLHKKQDLPSPQYELIDRIGPDHNPVFRVKVTAEPLIKFPKWIYCAIGQASKSKIAGIEAAEKLCDQIFLEYDPRDVFQHSLSMKMGLSRVDMNSPEIHQYHVVINGVNYFESGKNSNINANSDNLDAEERRHLLEIALSELNAGPFKIGNMFLNLKKKLDKKIIDVSFREKNAHIELRLL